MAPMINTKGEDERCPVSEERHGRIYRCTKRAGHDRHPGDEGCVADAPEYAAPPIDWHRLLAEAAPLLEWIARHPDYAGAERADQALRLFVRYQLAVTRDPKTRAF